MSDNWVVQNLENALNTWNEKLAEIWQLITQSPENFKGGTIWNVIVDIHGAVQAIGLALLVLFFVVGVMRTCGNFAEVKRPEQALKLFIRFAIAKGAATYGLELMMALFKIVQGMISTIMNAAGFGSAQQTVLPQELCSRLRLIDGCVCCICWWNCNYSTLAAKQYGLYVVYEWTNNCNIGNFGNFLSTNNRG